MSAEDEIDNNEYINLAETFHDICIEKSSEPLENLQYTTFDQRNDDYLNFLQIPLTKESNYNSTITDIENSNYPNYKFAKTTHDRSINPSKNTHFVEHKLAASTSYCSTFKQENITYLNKSQIYEIDSTIAQNAYLTGEIMCILRVLFHERKHSVFSTRHINTWIRLRPGERIVDGELPLCRGVDGLEYCKNNITMMRYYWQSGVTHIKLAFRVHCISTEFTEKKHGGEKGIPFRIHIETYVNEKFQHCSYCQIKLKGADRKNKNDKERITKKTTDERQKYRPVTQWTPFKDVDCKIALEHVKYLENQFNELKMSPSEHELTFQTESCTSEYDLSTKDNLNINVNSSPDMIKEWFMANRFSELIGVFNSFSGKDMMRLSKEDILKICSTFLPNGISEGIRLSNALKHSAMPPKLTLYLYQKYVEIFNQSVPTFRHSFSDTRGNSTIRNLSNENLTFKKPPILFDRLNLDLPNINLNMSKPDIKNITSDSSGNSSCTNLSNQSNISFQDNITPKRIFKEEKYTKVFKKRCLRPLKLDEQNVCYAIYLYELSTESLKVKLISLFGRKFEITKVYVKIGQNLKVVVTEEFIQNMKDQCVYKIEAVNDDECNLTDAYKIIMSCTENPTKQKNVKDV